MDFRPKICGCIVLDPRYTWDQRGTVRMGEERIGSAAGVLGDNPLPTLDSLRRSEFVRLHQMSHLEPPTATEGSRSEWGRREPSASSQISSCVQECKIRFREPSFLRRISIMSPFKKKQGSFSELQPFTAFNRYIFLLTCQYANFPSFIERFGFKSSLVRSWQWRFRGDRSFPNNTDLGEGGSRWIRERYDFYEWSISRTCFGNESRCYCWGVLNEIQKSSQGWQQ